MTSYPITKSLTTNAAIHCATLAVTEDITTNAWGWPQLAQPDPDLRSATLTFIKSGDRTYGITCHHVVKHYRDVLAASQPSSSYTMRIMLPGFYVVMDDFIQPCAQYGDPVPDIAIREINPDLLAHIGKEAMDLDVMKEAPEDIQHAYAVGFPEKLKYHRQDKRVALPQVEILAELQGRPRARFSMCSRLPKAAPDIDYSGMSGGPIFWSTQDDYGVLGIIYEGGYGEGNDTIYVYGELASPEVIKTWVAQCPPKVWPPRKHPPLLA